MTDKLIDNANHQDDYGFDLVASGSSGQWSVVIDETHTGRERYYAQIKGPAFYCSFEMSTIRIIDTLLRFLDPSIASIPEFLAQNSEKLNNQLRVGGRKATPVTFIRDDEYTDRCFLMVRQAANGLVIRYSVAGSDLQQLTDSVRKVREELKTEGLLPELPVHHEYMYNDPTRGEVRVQILKKGSRNSRVIQVNGVGESFTVPNTQLSKLPS